MLSCICFSEPLIKFYTRSLEKKGSTYSGSDYLFFSFIEWDATNQQQTQAEDDASNLLLYGNVGYFFS